MTEVLFYHLQTRTLEQALPQLLEKCVERGWRTVVQTGSPERRDALDAHLWSYSEESFLPHGTARDGDPADLAVLLTDDPAAPGPIDPPFTVRFLVDRAVMPDLAGLDRAVFVFDGNDTEAVLEARENWKTVKAAGLEATYWVQDERGRWVKKA
jgi:DNA polymerase-3 subunit chi